MLNTETIYKLLEHGLAVLLVIVGILMFTGAVASPITETRLMVLKHNEDTVNLKKEVVKIVRVLGIMCLNNAKNPESCIDAVIPTDAEPTAGTTSLLKGALNK
jgi:hypothetical protein